MNERIIIILQEVFRRIANALEEMVDKEMEVCVSQLCMSNLCVVIL